MIASLTSDCEVCCEPMEEGITEIRYCMAYNGYIHDDPDECDEDHPDLEDFLTL